MARLMFHVLVIVHLTFAWSAANALSKTIVTDQLNYPWGMAFISAEQVLITEKPGSLKKLNINTGKALEISGVPSVAAVGQGGLLDVIADNHFAENHRIYLSYSKRIGGGFTTAVAQATLKDNQLVDLTDIIVTQARSKTSHHFGSRLAFDHQGLLYITVGDRGDRNNAQDLKSHAGKLLRIHTDGSIPKDNPFVDRMDALPEIYSWGHRNPQGLDFDFTTKQLWLHEHGPKGGDELNLIKAGANYGWPVITYGREYSGFKITDQTHKPGMEQPVWKWVPSIAPSGLAIYRGDVFKDWHGDALIGALKFKLLSHVSLTKDGRGENETRYLNDHGERIRAVEVGPDGFVYLLTDSLKGQLIKLSP